MQILKISAATLLATVLVACGGGGGGGGGGGTLTGTLSVSPTSLRFLANGTADATPAAQSVTGNVTGVTSGTLYITIVGSGPAIAAISGVTITGSTSGQSTVSVPSPASLGIGTYTGAITVTGCLNDPQCVTGKLGGSPQTVNVTYDVAGVKTSAPSLTYTLMNSPQPADLTRQFTVTTFPSQNWTATTTASWLSITASGASGGTLTASLAQAALATLNNGTYTTTVHLVPATNGQALDIPVSLTVKRTQVDFVSPYVAYQGTSGNVVISGEEFSQLTGSSAIQNVLFGSTPAASYTVVSATEIHATYPANLAVGRYPIVLQSSYTATRQLANLVVAAPPAFTATVLAYPDANTKQIEALVYDAERATLGATIWYSSTGATSALRYGSTGGAWQSPVVQPLTNTFALALSADGAAWVAGVYRDVANLDPVTLAILATPASPINGGSSEFVFDLAVASNGTVAVTTERIGGCGSTLLFYNVRQESYTAPPFMACRARVGSSGDGSRLLLVNESTEFTTDDVFLADTTAGTLTATGLHALTVTEPVLDRAGDRLALNVKQANQTTSWQVYDGSYVLLGSLPATTLVVVLSPDGHKAHAYDQSGLLRSYDLTAAPVGGVFPEIGTGITLAGSPGSSTTVPGNPGTSGAPIRMAITPDGATVFVAGTDAVVVQPAP